MHHSFDTAGFRLEYMDNRIDHPVLLETHCHSQYEMIAVAEGDINIILEGKSYRLMSQQAMIIPPLSYHRVTANEQGTYRRFTVLFDISAVPPVLQPEFSQQAPEMVIISIPYLEKLKEICQVANPEFYEPLAQSLMVQIFYDVMKESKTADHTETDTFLQEALGYIDRHLHEKILLEDLARHTARSKSSFCHLFEQKMGISPKQYILQKKLALADKLISEGVPAITAAAQVGYENYSNFYRLYRKNTEKNPTSHQHRNSGTQKGGCCNDQQH